MKGRPSVNGMKDIIITIPLKNSKIAWEKKILSVTRRHRLGQLQQIIIFLIKNGEIP